LRLTKNEQEWLDAYREALRAEYPGAVEEVLIYGSKARGKWDRRKESGSPFRRNVERDGVRVL
jgi:hypothetical protein